MAHASSAAFCAAFSQRVGNEAVMRSGTAGGEWLNEFVEDGHHRDDSPAYSGR